MLLDDKRTRPKHYVSLVFLLVAASAAIIPLYWMLVTAVQQPTLTVTFHRVVSLEAYVDQLRTVLGTPGCIALDN